MSALTFFYICMVLFNVGCICDVAVYSTTQAGIGQMFLRGSALLKAL